MKAAVLTAPEKIELQELEKPQIKPREVLVKLAYCGICTLEQRLFSGAMKIYYPLIPGHEASGIVVEKGSEVLADYPLGTPVALDLVTRCGECHYCRTGKSNHCSNRFKKGQKVLGGFGQYIAVNASQVFPIPQGLSIKEAAFAEPVSCCIRSLKRVGLSLGEDLLILGAGPMGLLHLQVANAMGARVFVSDPEEKRRTLAKNLGAYKTLDPSKDDLPQIIKTETGGRGVDVSIVTTQARAALVSAFTCLSKTGRINVYTSYGDKPDFPMDANTLHREEYLITGSEGRTEQDFYTALRLLAFGRVLVTPLISREVSYSDLSLGIQEAMTTDTYRVLLVHEE